MCEFYELYIIETHLNIERTALMLKQESNQGEMELGPIRKEFYRDPHTKKYNETKRKLVLMKESLYSRLSNKGYTKESNEQLFIKKYNIKNNEYSNRTSSTMSYFFPTDDEVNVKFMLNRMMHFTKMGMVEYGDWYVHKNGVCELSENIKPITKVKIKIMLDNPMVYRVSWCRNSLFSKIKKKFESSESFS